MLAEIIADFEIAEHKYLTYLRFNSMPETTCEGVGNCDDCNKGMYPLRTTYLRRYIELYCANKKMCPKFHWQAANMAKLCNIGRFHKMQCRSGRGVDVCSCILADFVRVAYGDSTDNITDATEIPSFSDQIWPMLRAYKGG